MIKIKRNTCGDTRVCKELPTKEEFQESNKMHRKDVQNCMDFFSEMIQDAGILHDYTKVINLNGKIRYADDFWEYFKEAIENDGLYVNNNKEIEFLDEGIFILRDDNKTLKPEMDAKKIDSSIDSSILTSFIPYKYLDEPRHYINRNRGKNELYEIIIWIHNFWWNVGHQSYLSIKIDYDNNKVDVIKNGGYGSTYEC